MKKAIALLLLVGLARVASAEPLDVSLDQRVEQARRRRNAGIGVAVMGGAFAIGSLVSTIGLLSTFLEPNSRANLWEGAAIGCGVSAGLALASGIVMSAVGSRQLRRHLTPVGFSF